MFKIQTVWAVWFIIVGGIIIFINGDRGCLACNGILLTTVGVINVLIGVIGLASGLRSDPMPGRE